MTRRQIGLRIVCWITGHNWTCNAEQGVKPTDLTLEGFKEYSKMYCKDCGYESKLNYKK